MRSNRFPTATILSLAALTFASAACVPNAPADGRRPRTDGGGPMGTGGSGNGTGTTACPDTDVVVDRSDGGAGGAGGAPAKMACSNETVCFPYVRPYTQAESETNRATAMQLMSVMDDKQKANQLRGTEIGQYGDIERTWHDRNITDYSDTGGVREFMFRDASRGINFAVEGVGDAYATAFPVSMARGAAFDVDLEYRIGQAVGDEMVASGNTMMLAPCVNILRHPLWGRAQETYGEDSFQLGRIGTAYVVGIQEYVGACAKHYAANNIENGRQFANASMDEQTLREIYGRHFEMMIRDGGMAGVMAAYNKVNGSYSTENRHLLTDILRGTAATGGFDFNGLVLSDWWAIQNHQDFTPNAMLANNAIQAGLDIELGWNLNYRTLEASIAGGTLSRDVLNTAALRVLEQKVRFNGTDPFGEVGLRPAVTNYNGLSGGHSITNNEVMDPVVGKSHIELAQESAIKSMVLLKNTNNTLPISRTAVSKIAVLGRRIDYGAGIHFSANDQNMGIIDFARTPATGDLGSSRVFIDKSKSFGPLAGIQAVAGSGITVEGFDTAAAATTFNPDFVVVVAGLTPLDEGEEYTQAGDRTTFDLDAKIAAAGQVQLINDAIAMGKPMVLVLVGGSVITIPSLNSLPAVIMAWYAGMDGGRALGKLLFGDANFSAKLPITWPRSLADIPYGLGPADDTPMGYYLGYRMYDDRRRTNASAPTPLFPFGHGLSYTTFSYANLHVPCGTIDENSSMNVTVEVTNEGDVAGDEVVFLFASYPNTTARRSVKELKSFRKVHLEAHQTKRINIPLRIADLKYFKMDNPTANTGTWVVEKGMVQVMVGGSSDNLPLSDTFQVN
jgi:beta-glucosidase